MSARRPRATSARSPGAMSARRCSDVRDALARCDVPTAAQEEHLKGCASCRAVREELSALDARLAALRPSPPDGLPEQIGARVRREGSGSRGGGLALATRLASIGTFLAAALLLPIVLWLGEDVRRASAPESGVRLPAVFSSTASRDVRERSIESERERLMTQERRADDIAARAAELARRRAAEEARRRAAEEARRRAAEEARRRAAEEGRRRATEGARQRASSPGARSAAESMRRPSEIAPSAKAREGGPPGAVLGTVVDAEGAPFPFADVFLDGEGDTSFSQAVLTDEEGRFRFRPVPAGTFELYAFASGFVSDKYSNLVVDPGSRRSYEIRLLPQEAEEEIINVNAALQDLVDVERTDVSMALQGEYVNQIPLQNKRIRDIVALFPGVVTSGPSDSADISIGGGTGGEVGFRLNGATINDPISGGAALDIPTASIESFKLITTGFSARYGEQSTGMAEVVMREDPATSPLARLLHRLGPLPLETPDVGWEHVTLDRPVYFEDRYVAGNAEIRLAQQVTEALGPTILTPPGVPTQGFDPPTDGAMALHVDLDRPHVAPGETGRVHLQVGLKATDAAAWRRASASVIIAASGGADAIRAATTFRHALADELNERDRLGVARPNGGVRLRSPIETPPEAILSIGEGEAAAAAIRSLVAVFENAEHDGRLRNRRVVLVSDRALDHRLERAAASLSTADVTLSVVSVGAPHPGWHARVAGAANGNVHAVATGDTLAAAAEAAARAEARSLSRVVARSVRLSIRPADGVRLVRVLGTRPLDRREVRRVKATERATDRTVERVTGILADRGEDDAGLQTVIPQFLAGDEHLVLVELESDGSGPVADVSVQSKDLVAMENRTLHAAAALHARPTPATERHRAVAQNVIGFRVAEHLQVLARRAGREGLTRDDADALRALARRLTVVPALSSDARLLEELASAIEARPGTPRLGHFFGHAWSMRLGRSLATHDDAATDPAAPPRSDP